MMLLTVAYSPSQRTVLITTVDMKRREREREIISKEEDDNAESEKPAASQSRNHAEEKEDIEKAPFLPP